MENVAVQNSLAILKTPKFWTAINSTTNFLRGLSIRIVKKTEIVIPVHDYLFKRTKILDTSALKI